MSDRTSAETLRTQTKEALKNARISQAEAARQLGLSTKHMSQMLTGRATLALDWADRILALCGAHLELVAAQDKATAPGPRTPLDDLTSDALDQLYARIVTLQAVCESNKRAYKGAVQAAWDAEARVERAEAERDMLGRETDRLRKDWVAMRDRAERAEAANERVRTIADRWAQYGSNELRTAARVLHIEGLAEQSAAVGQQPTTDAPFGDRHGPTPEEVRAGRAGLFTVFGPPVSCPHCGPEAAPVPSTHWTKHVQRHHPEQQPTT